MIGNVSEVKNLLKQTNTDKWVSKTKDNIQNEVPVFNTKDLGKMKNEGPASGTTFGEYLADSIGKVNQLQADANQAIMKLATGKTRNIHETLLAVEKADLAFRTMNQIRNKIIDTYREIMKMQI